MDEENGETEFPFTESERSSIKERIINEKEPVDEPPNGGLKAWLQVVGGFFLFFNSW